MSDEFAQFSAAIKSAIAAARPLRIRGGGTKDFYGQALRGEILDTRACAGIVAYEPTELVITARAGTALTEIESALEEKGQMLAFEPPHFGAGFGTHATLGGAIAAGLCGPRRATAGALRDFVLGIKIMDGRGEIQSFGGQVMKNVAGYDVSRLMAGALGTLGLILEASLKVLPRPVTELTLRLHLPQDQALEAMNRWAGQPLPVSATCWHDDELTVRLSGAKSAVTKTRELIGGELIEDGDEFWRGVREQSDQFFAADGFTSETPLWRLAVTSTCAPLVLPGRQLIEWGGSLRWFKTNASTEQARAVATVSDGHATLFRGGDKTIGVFQPLPAALMQIHRRLKHAFDPHGVFNPGRMYEDL